MSNIDEKFKRKAEQEIKNYELIKTVFTKIYDIEKELLNKRKSSFQDIANIDEDDNEIVKKIYQDFTKQMDGLERYRENLMKKIQEKIIPASKYYIFNAKQAKKDIGKYKDKKKQNEKQEFELEKAKASRNTKKESQISEDIKQSKLEINKELNSIQKNMMLYERDRVVDSKYIILHFVHCEMAYHAKSVEKLSKLYKDISVLNPKVNIKGFIDKMNFQSVNAEDYGYDEREFTNYKKSTLKGSNIGDSYNKSLKVSGIGRSRKGMIQSQNSELNKIEEDEIEENGSI